MSQSRSEIVAWVGAQILPHEADVRGWLRRVGAHPDDIDDIVQEAYCRLAGLASVGIDFSISQAVDQNLIIYGAVPKAYFKDKTPYWSLPATAAPKKK